MKKVNFDVEVEFTCSVVIRERNEIDLQRRASSLEPFRKKIFGIPF